MATSPRAATPRTPRTTDIEIKAACRSGLDPERRRAAWLALATTRAASMDLSRAPADLLAAGSARYQHAVRAVFGNVGVAAHCFSVPTLGGGSSAEDVEGDRPAERRAAHDRIVCTLAQQFSLQHFPQLSSLVSAMLSYMSEVEAYIAVVRRRPPPHRLSPPHRRLPHPALMQERLVVENARSDMLLASPRIDGAFVAMFLCAGGTQAAGGSSTDGLVRCDTACPPARLASPLQVARARILPQVRRLPRVARGPGGCARRVVVPRALRGVAAAREPMGGGGGGGA